MKIKGISFAIFFFFTIALYNLWSLKPIKILYVYSDAGSEVFIVVDHLAWSDRDKISWFLSKRDEFIKKQSLYYPTEHHYLVMSINDGFTNYINNTKDDLYCFPTIKTDLNCLVKNYLLIVTDKGDGSFYFYIPSSSTKYVLGQDEKLIMLPA